MRGINCGLECARHLELTVARGVAVRGFLNRKLRLRPKHPKKQGNQRNHAGTEAQVIRAPAVLPSRGHHDEADGNERDPQSRLGSEHEDALHEHACDQHPSLRCIRLHKRLEAFEREWRLSRSRKDRRCGNRAGEHECQPQREQNECDCGNHGAKCAARWRARVRQGLIGGQSRVSFIRYCIVSHQRIVRMSLMRVRIGAWTRMQRLTRTLDVMSTASSHSDPRPRLSATVMPLTSGANAMPLREAFAWLSSAGYSAVQLSATDPLTRPRELSRSARSDLASALTRSELVCSGVDFFIPPAHFLDSAQLTRAMESLLAAVEFAAQLCRVPVVAAIPVETATDVVAEIAATAAKLGSAVLIPVASADSALIPAGLGACLDCAAALGLGQEPHAVVATLGNRLGGVRVVDLLRSGMRGPIHEPRESRLDAMALRAVLDVASFRGIPVMDARQWPDPRAGLARSIERW